MEIEFDAQLIEAGVTEGYSWVVEKHISADLAYMLVPKGHRWFRATERSISREVRSRVNYICADENNLFVRVGFASVGDVPGIESLIRAIKEVAKRAALKVS